MTIPTPTVGEIISKYTKGELSSRPAFYTGRGNNPGDLNSKILEKVYGGIKTEIGDKAAKAFVQMVEQMTEDASATTFLVALQHLEARDWEMTAHTVPTEVDAFAEVVANAQRKDPNEAMASLFAGMASMMGREGGMGYHASAITGDFLKRHAHETEKQQAPSRSNSRQTGTGMKPEPWTYE